MVWGCLRNPEVLCVEVQSSTRAGSRWGRGKIPICLANFFCGDTGDPEREKLWRWWMPSGILNSKSITSMTVLWSSINKGHSLQSHPFQGVRVMWSSPPLIYLLRRCSCIHRPDFYFLLYHVPIFSKFPPWHVLFFFLNYKNNPKCKKSVT